jgi:putative glutamine amidotransferase
VHTVRLESQTRLASILGSGDLGTNSSHHQAVKNLGRLFTIAARAGDGVIEGMESPGHRFAVAVQWHPEELYSIYPRHSLLFRALVEAAGSLLVERFPT